MMIAQSAHPWLARFCIHLLRQLPAMTARTAIQQAVARYPYCADQVPERVAQSLVTTTRAMQVTQGAYGIQLHASRPERTARVP